MRNRQPPTAQPIVTRQNGIGNINSNCHPTLRQGIVTQTQHLPPLLKSVSQWQKPLTVTIAISGLLS
jgi:hypothetical protein